MIDVPVSDSVAREVRHAAGPWIDRAARAFGDPTTHVHPRGYVGTVDRPLAALEATLRDGPFSWDPVSVYHYTPVGSSTDGSWVYRPSPLAHRQIHVVLFSRGAGATDVYAHEEYSWLRHPLKHAREVDLRRRDAVAEVRGWLDRNDVPYERRSRVRRRLEHVVGRLQERREADNALR